MLSPEFTKIDNLNSNIDERGVLSVLNYIPFDVKRLFYIYNVPKNSVRGNHSHYITKQYLICIKGEITLLLHDGKNEFIYQLKENTGIFVDNLIWDKFQFLTSETILLVLASTDYDRKDYITDFDKFLELKSDITITV